MRRRRQTNKRKRHQKRKKQRGGFLNRHDFVYAGRDTVNQVGNIARELIRNASSEINNIAQQPINQVVSQGGKEIERKLSAQKIWKTTAAENKNYLLRQH